MNYTFFIKVFISLALLGCNTNSILKKNHIVACIGDSTTYSGGKGYVKYIQDFVDDKHTNLNLTFLNWGKNSETITHLTEKTHPGPRPFLFDRLDQLLTQTPSPNIVTFCYGINCGIYGKPYPELFKKYNDGLDRFLDITSKKNIKVILITPPPLALEAAKFHGNAKLSAVNDIYDWRTPYKNYQSEVLEKFREIVLSKQHPNIIGKIDIQHILLKNQNKAYGKDPIHPNEYGNKLIGDSLINFFF